MAYGTATVPRVDKIVGPGNRWVSAAKSLVSADCGIDFYAGPDGDPDRRRCRVSRVDRRRSARASRTRSRCARRDDHHEPRGSRARCGGSRAANAGRRPGQPIDCPARRHRRVPSVDERSIWRTARRPNTWSPDTESIARRITNAGAIFIGGWTAQVAGDYAIGSNHVLPTAGAARYRGGLERR